MLLYRTVKFIDKADTVPCIVWIKPFPQNYIKSKHPLSDWLPQRDHLKRLAILFSYRFRSIPKSRVDLGLVSRICVSSLYYGISTYACSNGAVIPWKWSLRAKPPTILLFTTGAGNVWVYIYLSLFYCSTWCDHWYYGIISNSYYCSTYYL